MGDFDLVGLEVFFTAFEKINAGLGFSLRCIRIASSLLMRSFVWFLTISLSLLKIGQFLEKA